MGSSHVPEMVLNNNDKAIISACFLEKGWCGARIVKEFPRKKWNRQTINRFIQKLRQTGSTDRKQGSGRRRTATTDENKEYVADVIVSQEDNPGTHRSQRQIARDLGISRTSVQAINKELGLKAYKRIRTSRKDGDVKQKRKTRSKNLYGRFSAADVKKLVFTDEKDFPFEVARNRQNDRVYGKKKTAISTKRLYHECSRFTKKIMVSAGVSWNGKTRLHFIDTKKVKVNSESYQQLLKSGLLPDCRRLYPNGNFVFQQDGASSHTSKSTQDYLEKSVPDFIKKDQWPPMSPDLNPMDYSIWNSLSEKVYEGRKEKFTEAELKKKLKQSWQKITLKEVHKAVRGWKPRLREVFENNGGPIEHLLK